MQALSLTTLFIISPADQVPQISIFSLARFRTAINVLGDSIGAGIVNHLSKVIFFLVNLYDISCPFCLAQRGGLFGRISKVRRKLGGTVSSSKNSSEFYESSQKGQPPKFPHFLYFLMSWLHITTSGGIAAAGQAGARGTLGVDGREGWGQEGGAELRKNVFGKYIWSIAKTSVNG